MISAESCDKVSLSNSALLSSYPRDAASAVLAGIVILFIFIMTYESIFFCTHCKYLEQLALFSLCVYLSATGRCFIEMTGRIEPVIGTYCRLPST